MFGDNGSGKTNLLEALYVANNGESFRTQDIKELILFGESAAHASMGFLDLADVQHTIQLLIPTSGRRVLQKDGQNRAVSKYHVFGGPMIVCWVQDAKVVAGEPAQRRAFLDEQIPALVPQYGSTLDVYRRIIEQKNRLLRDESTGSSEKSSQIHIWNEQLIEGGARIVSARLRFLSQLRPILAEYYARIAGEDAKISVDYASRCEFREDMSEMEIAAVIRRELDQNLDRELVIGNSIRGPHRDDVRLCIGGKEARDYASEGQVRSLALCLKLAMRDLLEQTVGEQPVMLIDDVGSELDPDRRDRAIHLLAEKGQVFMACQDPGVVERPLAARMGEVAIWQIRDGAVTVR
jgi:DNA replication and repair protein RecF